MSGKSNDEKPAPAKRRHGYRYVLHGYKGAGTYMSESESIEAVKNELLDIFGDDLYMVEGEVVSDFQS